MKRWIILLATLAAQPALAHAMLEHATPAADATVRTAPKQIVLTFSEALEPSVTGVEVRAANGDNVEDSLETNDRTIKVTLLPLKPGRYKVNWHAVSIDTHRTEGSYTFTLKP